MQKKHLSINMLHICSVPHYKIAVYIIYNIFKFFSLAVFYFGKIKVCLQAKTNQWGVIRTFLNQNSVMKYCKLNGIFVLKV